MTSPSWWSFKKHALLSEAGQQTTNRVPPFERQLLADHRLLSDRPSESLDFGLLHNLQCVVDFDSQVADSALELSVS